MSASPSELHGRLISLDLRGERVELTIRNQKGIIKTLIDPALSEAELPRPGDLVRVRGDRVEVLTATLQESSGWMEHVLNPRRLHAVKMRTQVEGLIRRFFLEKDFLETRTPLLVPCPGMEIHIRPYELKSGAFLPTSPEFAMKRLLVGGLEKIFQITPAFRYEPDSRTHHPEFTMLEWYRAYSNVAAIMEDTERLFEFIAMELFGKPEIRFQGKTLNVKTPWPRLRVRDLFLEFAGVDLVAASTAETLAVECMRLGISVSETDTWDDLYFRIWLNLIEPRLPEDRAVFVHRYPKSQAALAVVDRDPDGSEWAKRFEVYAAGLELGNAFEELTDAREQRARFTRDMETRTAIYGDRFAPSPIDEGFLRALEEGLPPSGGIAIGVDRMVMLYADEPEIDYTQWLKPFAGTEPVPPAI